MGEARYGQQRSVVEVLDESFMVDCSAHENDLEGLMFGQQFLELKQEKVSIDGPLMNLRKVSHLATHRRDLTTNLIHNNMRHSIQ